MSEEATEYRLGRNVTAQFKSNKPADTAVLSLRLFHDEFEALHWMAQNQGKTVSQVARELIRKGLKEPE